MRKVAADLMGREKGRVGFEQAIEKAKGQLLEMVDSEKSCLEMRQRQMDGRRTFRNGRVGRRTRANASWLCGK